MGPYTKSEGVSPKKDFDRCSSIFFLFLNYKILGESLVALVADWIWIVSLLAIGLGLVWLVSSNIWLSKRWWVNWLAHRVTRYDNSCSVKTGIGGRYHCCSRCHSPSATPYAEPDHEANEDDSQGKPNDATCWQLACVCCCGRRSVSNSSIVVVVAAIGAWRTVACRITAVIVAGLSVIRAVAAHAETSWDLLGESYYRE